MERMVGDDWGWQHIEDGEENAPSHVRAALAGTQVLIPLDGGTACARHVAGHLLLRVRRPARAQGLRHAADLIEVEQPPAVISARGVVKRYGRTVALAGLDAEIGPGITGLLGSNGAGKTTFISLVLGLRSRDSGELTVLGRDPATAGIEVRSRIGYAPEHHDLPSELAATDFVRHLAEMHLLPRRAAVQRANDALWLVGLGEERFRPVGNDVDGPAAAGQARLGDRPRSRARPARRADRRARPDAADGDARADPPNRHRVRRAHRRVVPPPRGGGADLRRGRDRRGRGGRARREARGSPARPGRTRRRGGRAG